MSIEEKSMVSTKDKKRLVSNFTSLAILQGANYILPLLTLPYLMRVLGPEKFGLIAFATSFIGYFQILTDYGFSLSATREIAISRNEVNKVSEIYSSVMIIKFALMLLSFAAMSAIVFGFGKFRNDWIIYFLTFGSVAGQVMFPIWLFQGLETMKYITLVNIVSKVFFTVLIFVFIRKTSDFIYVPLINSLGYILAGLISLRVVVKNLKIKFRIPEKSALVAQLKHSTQFFLSRASISMYTSSNAFVLGLFTSNAVVGYYSAAEKLYIAVQNVYLPLNNVLYPYVSSTKNVELFKRAFNVVNVFNVILATAVMLLANQIILLVFGNGLNLTVDVLRVFALVTMIVIPSILLGYPFLAALGCANYANGSVIVGSLIHIIGLCLLVITSNVSAVSVALMVLLTEGVVLCVRIYGINVNKLWRYSS